MDVYAKLIYFVVDLVLPLGVGYALRRWRAVPERWIDRAMLWDLVVLGTFLALVSFWGLSFRTDLLWLPVLGVIMQVLPGLVGAYRARRPHLDALERGSFVMSTMLSNRGVVGTLTVFILYGDTGFAYAQLVMLLAPVVLYLFCFPMARRYQAEHAGVAGEQRGLLSLLLDVKQIPVLGLLAGALLNAGGIERPGTVQELFAPVMHVFLWGTTIPIGYSMEFGKMRRYLGTVGELIAVKFALTPLATWGLGWAVGLRGDVLAALVILAAAPTALNAVITARLHGLNVHLAAAAFFLTTIAYFALVLPVILLLAG